MSPSTIFIIMKPRGFRYIWSLVVLDTIKIFNFSCKSILVAEMLSKSTSVEGTAGDDLFQPYLPSERSCITKTHGYSNCHLYCEIRQVQPEFHQKLTCLNARALSAKSESMKTGWNRRYFLSFPSYSALTQTRQMGSEKARDVIIPVSS